MGFGCTGYLLHESRGAGITSNTCYALTCVHASLNERRDDHIMISFPFCRLSGSSHSASHCRWFVAEGSCSRP